MCKIMDNNIFVQVSNKTDLLYGSYMKIVEFLAVSNTCYYH